MYTILEKIDKVKKSINIVMSENRHVFSVEDNQLLESCIDELEKLKEEVVKAGNIEDNSFIRLIRIIKLLDTFFGLSGTILEFIEDLN